MSTPQVGARVRVVIEGVYQRSGERTAYLTKGDGVTWATFNDDIVAAVEVLPPPEPEWEPGDVVLDRSWVVHARCEDNDGWLTPGISRCSGSPPRRTILGPLILLVRGGKPVQS